MSETALSENISEPKLVGRAGQGFYLTADEMKQFRRDGFIGPFNLYEPDEIKKRYKQIRAGLFDRSNAIFDLPTNSIIANYDRHLDIDALSMHIMRREIVNRVESVLGPDVICWRSEMFPKYPGDEGTDWHQADTFAHASGKPQLNWPQNTRFGGALTVWTAMTDATEANGCLRFIPGTHEEMLYDESLGMEFKPETVNALDKAGIKRGFYGYDYRNLQKDKDWKPNEDDAVSIVMRAGQFVMFWSTLMHSSYPNTTESDFRLGYACRYVPSTVSVYPDTDVVEEYGSSISLDRYGVVVVAGENRNPSNRVRTKSATGYSFES